VYVYKTVNAPAQASYKVLGSKHLAFIFPVSNENDVKDHLAALRSEHEGANHVCFAYRLGPDFALYRFSDDGEPSGTAGKPIYGQIQSFGLTNVLIAVVRYFGGTKLGTGGLIEAYRTASRMAIEQASIVEREVEDIIELTFAYINLPHIMHWIKSNQLKRLSLEEGDYCVLLCQIETSKLKRAIGELARLGAETKIIGRVN
jgi:uncharacterized YigZ family protein